MSHHRNAANLLGRLCKRTYFVAFLPNKNSDYDLLHPHWGSEVLIPTIDFESKQVISFNRATSPSEQSHYGGQFLEKNSQALIHAGNSVLYSDYGTGRSGGRGTAFQVGQGSLTPEFMRV
jgi:hypothetical protein